MFELKKWEPFRELSALQREMDEMFRRTFAPIASGVFRHELASTWMPGLNCFTKNGNFVVHCDLPGVDPKDVEITVTGNLLTVKGERKSVVDEKKGGYVVHESEYGAFERTITLPEGVETAKVHATVKNGVLEVVMPSKAEALTKRVKIEIEGGKEEKESKEGAKAA